MPKKKINIKVKNESINRDLSWLSFNERVLQEASDVRVPLIERLRFLGIFSNNLHQFFKVSYATVKRILVAGKGNNFAADPADARQQDIQFIGFPTFG